MGTIIFKTILVYAALLLLLRLLGKRQLGEMELSEFVVAALMANLAAHALEEAERSMLPPLLAIAVLGALEMLTGKRVRQKYVYMLSVNEAVEL